MNTRVPPGPRYIASEKGVVSTGRPCVMALAAAMLAFMRLRVGKLMLQRRSTCMFEWIGVFPFIDRQSVIYHPSAPAVGPGIQSHRLDASSCASNDPWRPYLGPLLGNSSSDSILDPWMPGWMEDVAHAFARSPETCTQSHQKRCGMQGMLPCR